jgi:Family of unknown function (DUF5681)
LRRRERRKNEEEGKSGNSWKTSNSKIVEAGKTTRFQPGQSGNPSGRPKDLVTRELRELMLRQCYLDKKRRSWGEVIAEAIGRKARNGDVRAFEAIADRTDGKPAQAVSVSADFSGDVTVGSYALTGKEEVMERLKELTERIRARSDRAKAKQIPQ